MYVPPVLGILLVMAVAALYSLAAFRKRNYLVVIAVVIFFLFLANFVIFLVLEDNARKDRINRIRTPLGSVIELNKDRGGTEECVQSFKFKVREDDGYKRLPYTFEVDCDAVLRRGDVLSITFVAPEEKGGKPEVLGIYNLTLEIENYSRPPKLPQVEAQTK